MAEVCNPNSSWPIIWAANCYEEQKDWTNAQHYLEVALEAVKDSHDENKNELTESLTARLAQLRNLNKR